jgi:hypothetical protein
LRIINFFLILLFFIGTSFGAETPGDNQSSDHGFTFFSRPNPAGTPTPVKAGIVFLDVKKIDDVEQNFDADIFMSVDWFDPRLADKTAPGVRFFGMNDIWQPHVTIFNPRKLDKQLDDVFTVDPRGNVQYRQRFIGKLSSPLDLKNFPADQQTLPVILFSMRYGPEEIDLQVDKKRFTIRKSTSVVGWSIKLDKPRVGSEYFDVQDRYLSHIDFNLTAKRALSVKNYLPDDVNRLHGLDSILDRSLHDRHPDRCSYRLGLFSDSVSFPGWPVAPQGFLSHPARQSSSRCHPGRVFCPGHNHYYQPAGQRR